MGLGCVCTYVLVVVVSTWDLHLPCLSFAENRRGRARAVRALRQCRVQPALSGEPLSGTHSMNRYQGSVGA